MLTTMLFALAMLSPQDPPAPTAGAVTWTDEAPAASEPAAPPPPIPDSARADPYGYERAECSPLIRSAGETMEACQARVRMALAANLGTDLPEGMAPGMKDEECRREAAGDRYALQCDAPTRSAPLVPRLADQQCRSQPRRQPNGAVVWEETCRSDGREPEREGLRSKLWGDDD